AASRFACRRTPYSCGRHFYRTPLKALKGGWASSRAPVGIPQDKLLAAIAEPIIGRRSNRSTNGHAKGCGASCVKEANSADEFVGGIINAGQLPTSRYAD